MCIITSTKRLKHGIKTILILLQLPWGDLASTNHAPKSGIMEKENSRHTFAHLVGSRENVSYTFDNHTFLLNKPFALSLCDLLFVLCSLDLDALRAQIKPCSMSSSGFFWAGGEGRGLGEDQIREGRSDLLADMILRGIEYSSRFDSGNIAWNILPNKIKQIEKRSHFKDRKLLESINLNKETCLLTNKDPHFLYY